MVIVFTAAEASLRLKQIEMQDLISLLNFLVL
jgi:hypothetical protein